MSSITVFSSPYITVEYHPQKKLIYHVIHQPCANQPQIIKKALTAGTDALKKYNICKWLSDDRQSGPWDLESELTRWSIAEWQPSTVKSGWKYWANVVPQDMKAAGTLSPAIQNLSRLGLRVAVFTEVEHALAWLDTVYC